MSETLAGPRDGRRERKKVETREALRSAALQLFATQGFAATTVEQIADSADVSERTFFRYFDSKHDLLVPELATFFEMVERELLGRPLDEPPLEACLAAVLAVGASQAGEGGVITIAPGLDPADPAVSAHLVRAFVNWEDRLTDVLAARLRAAHVAMGADAVESYSTVTARIAVAATRAAMRIIRGRPEAQASERTSILREAFALAGSGCALRTAVSS